MGERTKPWRIRGRGLPRKQEYLRSGAALPPVNALRGILPDQILAAFREANLRPELVPLVSREALARLNIVFKNEIEKVQLVHSELEEWSIGKWEEKQKRVATIMREAVFEEVISREFILSEQRYFLTNRTMTIKIFKSISDQDSQERPIWPNHLVLLKKPGVSTLVGFMDEITGKELLANPQAYDDLERAWDFWLLLANDGDLQNRLRERFLFSLNYPRFSVEFGQVNEGKIWLGVTRDANLDQASLPRWIERFDSQFSTKEISRLGYILIMKLFLPRLLEDRRINAS